MRPTIIKIGGEAGFGIMIAGLSMAKLATRSGYHAFAYSEYPSIIRGGYNVMQIAIGQNAVRAPYQTTDILLALNQEAVTHHIPEYHDQSVIIFDPDQKINFSNVPKNVLRVPVPLSSIAKTIGGTVLMRNTAALGALCAVTGSSLKIFQQLLADEFAKKKKDVAEKNKKVAQAAYDAAKASCGPACSTLLAPRKNKPQRLVLTGNEAIAYGAIAAGLQFAAVYPMTPTSNILHTLAPHQAEYGYVYKQPEDEIAAINMAIGASFAGARSMTATAGGGFCLMAEAYGLAGITETPVVMIVGMRGGPATGLPTWTEQADLRFVLHAAQGDFPRLVLAPGDVDEAFHMTMLAFNLTEKYQTPVIVLVDKHLCESQGSTAPFTYSNYKIERGPLFTTVDPKYKRYALTASGVSPRAFAGSGNHILANSDEHTEVGYSDETIENREAMMEKRMHKLLLCAERDMPKPTVYGPQDADLSIISWGSNKGAILDAMEKFPNVNFLHLTWLNPFPADFVEQFICSAKRTIIMECNFTGQLQGLIREKTGLTIAESYLKYDGRPFFVDEIIAHLEKIV